MKFWSRLASVFVATVVISAAQTEPAKTPLPASSAAAPPATAPPATAPPPTATAPPASVAEGFDLTFKPEAVEPTPPATVPSDKTKPVPATADSKPQEPEKKAAAAEKKAPSKGKAAGETAASAAPAKQAGDPPEYVIGPTDLIEVQVWDNPNLSRPYLVGPDGRMSMPLIASSFRASGMTSQQLRDVIVKKLHDEADILDPIVNVQVVRFNSKKYTIIGGVGRPGPAPLVQEMTIFDALASAGGFRDFANKKKITLLRGTKLYKFNYDQVSKGQHMEQNITIQDGDIINVPE